MKRSFLIAVSQCLILFSCNKSNSIDVPPNCDSCLAQTQPIATTIMKQMEGIYNLVDGDKGLGNQFVCKVSKKKISFFSDKSGIYIILGYGMNVKDSSILLNGFWRYSETDEQGSINFYISGRNGGSSFISNGSIDHLKLSGHFSGENSPAHEIVIQFTKHFTQFAIDHEFMIFAHHGIQTDNDPPYTENSLDAAIHAGDYGVNGLEFDVHLTEDGIPICAHDADIETRDAEKGPLSGDYIQYTYATLDSLLRLTDGERIATVDQVLDAFIDSTTLKYMWLDVKGDPNIFKYLDPIVRAAYSKAALANRQVVIFADLTSSDVIAEFHQWPDYASLPTICETSLDDAINNNCQFWGPRYTLGLLLDQVARAHSLGMKVLTWTLDDKDLIEDYLASGKFDGFITDFPAYVVYDFYTQF